MATAKKQTLRQQDFINAAVNTVIKHADDEKLRSIQGLIDIMVKDYKSDKHYKLPCRDTMYKYFNVCITDFEQENDVVGLNPYNIFKAYSKANYALIGLKKLTEFTYATVSEGVNGFYIGLLTVNSGKEKAVSDYISSSFSSYFSSFFTGVGGILIIFKSANKEAEFFNLLTPHNSL
ncbi:MAG: hypothetical protein K5756_08695 [Clostridiales bacterium]|nr:hypothetical protein [Clostridiales bacterium]